MVTKGSTTKVMIVKTSRAFLLPVSLHGFFQSHLVSSSSGKSLMSAGEILAVFRERVDCGDRA